MKSLHLSTLASLLSSSFLLAVLSGCNQANDSGEQHRKFVDEIGVSYEQYGQEWHITDYRGNQDSIIIPSTKTDGDLTLPVTAIEANAFYGRSQLIAIELPDSIVSIGDDAFKGTSLQTFYGTPYLTKISDSAFEGTPFSDESDNGVVFLPSKTNPHCIAYKPKSWFTSYTYPSDIECINEGLFEDATFASTPDLSNLITVGKAAFRGAKINGEVDLSKCFSIGDSAFERSGITKVTFASEMKEIGERAFDSCPITGDIILPAGIERLGKYCFEGSSGIKNLSLPFVGNSPSEPTELFDLFGSQVWNLDSLTILGGEIVSEFASSYKITSLTLKNVTKVGWRAFFCHGELTSLTLENVREIEERAFYQCGFTEVSIPSSTQIIGPKAFYTDGRLYISMEYAQAGYSMEDSDFGANTEMRPFGGEGKTFGDWMAIETNSGLYLTKYVGKSTSVVVPTSLDTDKAVNKISRNAFEGRSDIVSVTLPAGPYWDGDGLLAPCTALESLTVRGVYNDEELFGGTVPSTLKNLTILGDTVWEENFKNYTSVEKLTFASEEGLKIGELAFHCPKVTDVYLPPKTTVYAYGLSLNPAATIRVHNSNDTSNWGHGQTKYDYSWKQWTNTSRIVMVDGPQTMPTDPQGFQFTIEDNGEATVVGFAGKATSVVIPSEFNGAPVTKIAKNAFELGGSKLKSIIVPDSIIYIAFNAFQGCSSLERISLPFVGTSANPKTDSDEFFAILFDGESKTTNYYVGRSGSTLHSYVPKTLKKIRITGDIVPYRSFRDMTSVTEIILSHEGVQVGSESFFECSALRKLYLPKGAICAWTDFKHNENLAVTTGYEEGDPDFVTEYGKWVDEEFTYFDLFSSVTYGVDYEAYMAANPF